MMKCVLKMVRQHNSQVGKNTYILKTLKTLKMLEQ